LPDRGWSCSGLPPAPRAARIEPRFGATGAGSRMTARCPLPRRRTAVHVPNGPGSSSRAPTLASVRLRRFTRPWRLAPLQSRPACFIRSRSWGLGVGRDALLEGSRDGRPEGPSTRSVPHGVLRFARNEVRRGGPASAPSLANQGRDAGCSTGSLPPGGPALCQALSRLTESAALAPDVTGVPSRVSRAPRPGTEIPFGEFRLETEQRAIPAGPTPRRGVRRARSGIVAFCLGASPRDNTPRRAATMDPIRPSGSRCRTPWAGRSLTPRSARSSRTRSPARLRPVCRGGGPTSARNPRAPDLCRASATGDEDSVISLSKSVTLEKEAIARWDRNQRPIGRKITAL